MHKHSNKFCHPAQDEERQRHAAPAAATAATTAVSQHTAAAEIHGRYMQIHTRTSYSSEQLNSKVTIYQVQVLCCESTHGAYQK